MKLDRNTNPNKTGKYALIKLRTDFPRQIGTFIEVKQEAIDYGDSPESEFFLIRLKDKYAAPALAAYALAAYPDDQEYAMEVLNLAKQAAEHPNKKQPD